MAEKKRKQRAKELAKEFGYLPYMTERYLALWGEEETLSFLEACEIAPKTAIRINSLKMPIEQTVRRMKRKGIALKRVPWLEEGFTADFGDRTPGSLFEHLFGHYYVQGVPSMTVVKALDPQKGEVVMDLASAPGGKTTHISQLMENTGTVFSIELDRLRMRSLVNNIQRCGVTNAIALRGDARKLDGLGVAPDRILLDAPCSGEGLIPLDPARKRSKTMADIRYCATRQDELLDSVIKTLAPGGVLVYSTCSIAPEENEYVIDSILGKHPEMKIIQIDQEFGVPGYTQPYGVSLDVSLSQSRRFLPHIHGLEGFFICKMRKEGDR
ncbi:MAG: RsmB/NOP family class I SAM-dependent RNA methyltransferase [Candidatus Thorarchaeota archaeon]|nr:MAG: RsmB/NOP family class I SAM-dependent RNA methyltransferase [Candidatus Thorarchaeota archaeon]